MKKITIYTTALALGIAAMAFSEGAKEIETLAIGAKAPELDYKMELTNGKQVSLSEVKMDNGLLVVFSCNTCPFVVGAEGYGAGWEGRYSSVKSDATQNKVGMILVNSNEAKRDKGDSMSDMKQRAKDKGFEDIMYALDKSSKLADAFGARTTPHVFLFDKDMKLVYKGSIDDSNEGPEKVKQHYLRDAMNNLSKGVKIDPAETKSVGCSIKRV